MIGRPREKNEYNLSGDFGIGFTKKGKEFYFDLEDFDKIKDYCWNIHKSKSCSYVESRSRNMDDKIVKMHRIIAGAFEKNQIVDHINRDGRDNRKENLRITSPTYNAKNRGDGIKNNTGYNGVSYRKDNKKYRARITVNRKEINIGHFDDFESAMKARINAENNFYKEFARIDGNEKLHIISSTQ